ncbi:MAG TPA: hypothetical protein VJS92_07680, partial [Candidatus Polarisedimenticolaceae bacterium]|nr:hypothetical protein [Candidatus Polarisedimenticolaceae bacterium]
MAARGGLAVVVPFADHLGGMEAVALSLARRFVADGIPVQLWTCRHLRERAARSAAARPAELDRREWSVLQRAPLLDLSWILPGALALTARRAG